MSEPSIGHNSEKPKKDFSADRLKSFVVRIERLNGERKGLADDIKEVFGEAKSQGWDVKIMREVIKRRAMDPADLAEKDALLGVYEDAVNG